MNKQTKPFIWLIIFLVGFPQLSETIYTPSLTALSIDLGVSAGQMQQTLSIYFAGFATGVFLWGILSDFTGRKPSMIAGIILYITGSYLCLRATDFSYLLLARFIQALGAAAGSNVSQTILRDTYKDTERVAVFSKISAVLAFAPAAGPLLGSIIASIWGTRMVFWSLVLTGFIALCWSLWGLQETLNPASKKKYDLKAIIHAIATDRQFWLSGGLIGITNGIIFSYYGAAPFIFIDHLDFSVIEYGGIGFIIALASFSGAQYCKRLSKQRPGKQVLYAGNFLFLSGVLICLFAALFLAPFPKLLIAGLLLAIFTIMGGIACMLPVCLSQALVHHKAHLGLSGAVLGLYYYIIVGGITWLMSYLDNTSLLMFPLFLLFWFFINTGLIVAHRE